MANTYSQLYVQIVFAVKGRQNLISNKWKDELYKYITGIVTNENQKLISINGMPDHIHILIGIKPNRFINEKRWINGKFEWQSGFGAFTYSHSHLTNVINYIQNQEEHHKTKTFKEEYIGFLKAFEIDYKDEYVFEELI
jgi:REP element-mobilizing transposase RayT